MHKEILKLSVIVVVMTQILYSSTPDTEKTLNYATIAQIFNYHRITPTIATDSGAAATTVVKDSVLEEPTIIDKTLQFGLSEEALRFAIRTLVSVAVTLKSQHKTQQNFNDLIKKGFKDMPGNGFVMEVTNAILGIIKAEDRGQMKEPAEDKLTKKRHSDHPATTAKKARKYSYFQSNTLANLVARIYQEVTTKIADDKTPRVAQPVQHEFHGDSSCVSTASFNGHYMLPETKRAAREALLYKSKAQERALNTYLKTKLIGQNEAVDDFTNGIFCHEKGILMEDFLQQMKQVQGYDFFSSLYEERKPSVILLMGPSGTGKTAMFILAMQFLKKPYGIGSGADMTKAGYVGGKPEHALEQLFEKADTPEAAETGAVLYDEICKLGGSGGGSTDEFTSAGQHGLLTIIEGTKEILIEKKTAVGNQEISFCGRRILYVLAGAFSELIAHKKESSHADYDSRPEYTSDEHLITFGLKRELVNRVRTIVSVKPFTERNILQIMAFQDSPLKQILIDFEDIGINVEFDAASLDTFAKFSVQEGFGARNLSRQLQQVIILARKTQKDSKIRITAEHVQAFQRLYHPPQRYNSMFM